MWLSLKLKDSAPKGATKYTRSYSINRSIIGIWLLETNPSALTSNLDGNDNDIDWSDGMTESELNYGLLLVSSLPFHLAPRPVHRVEVVDVVGLLAPVHTTFDVSPVETRRSPPVGWRPRLPVKPPRVVVEDEEDVTGFDAVERVNDVHEVSRHEAYGSDQSTWAQSSPTILTSSYHTKIHSTIHKNAVQ